MNTVSTNRTQLVNLIFKGIAVAMGVAVIVLNILGTATPAASLSLLAFGLTCLGIASLAR